MDPHPSICRITTQSMMNPFEAIVRNACPRAYIYSYWGSEYNTILYGVSSRFAGRQLAHGQLSENDAWKMASENLDEYIASLLAK